MPLSFAQARQVELAQDRPHPHRTLRLPHLTPMSAPMLVFDGDCAFCHRAVQFILAHEQRTDLLFVPRDSALGRSLRGQYHLERVESLLWIEDGRAFTEFDAVAHTAAYVGGPYARLVSLARLLPRPLLAAGYRSVARLRKRLSGRPRNCLLLTAAQQQRFLE